ncbi:uncharacterized protein LOC110994744 [Pieris rapae]|uniref:uncharacterized protein LOC110994744 n=1 Tax=Pieris rapae TaxID=64459 RepID=UPI000B925717|nr:uncharacterized protein LOC110994744 [Pieris rapae]
MTDSMLSTIEKIKLQEQEQEAKLKEKREYETNITSLQRSIRDTLTLKEKLHDEEKALNERILKLASQIEVEKIKNKAIKSEVESLKKELEGLKRDINNNISNVWEIRSSYCEAVKQTSDEYDVWALLIKPVCTEPIVRNNTPEKEIFSNEGRLQTAIERREKALAERNRLLAEPDAGSEFVRIKNALRYLDEKVASLRN